MSDVISYKDLFDFSDNSEIAKATRAINGLEKAYGKFAGNMAGEAIRIGQSQAPLLDILRQLDASIGRVQLSNEAGRKQASKLAAEVDAQTRAYGSLKQAQKGVETSNKAVEGSLEALRYKLKQDREELIKLGESASPEKLQQLSQSIFDTKTKAEQLERAVRGVNSIFTAAKGSYNDLKTQNRLLTVELENLANTQSKGAQRTQESISREKELKDKIAANTAQLKSYDAELNKHFRNVGNYAEAIMGAVNSLTTERNALVAQEAALKRATAATGLSAAAQDKLQQELTETRAKLQANTGDLQKYGVGAQSTGASISSAFAGAGNSLKSFAVTMAVSTFGLTALAAAAGTAFQNNLKYSDSLSDVRKTTGLTKEATVAFGEALKGIDTRTDIDDLLKIGAIGGQLNIAKKELEGFTRSIDVAAVALSDDFAGGAEQIATELGKIDSIFKLSKDVGVAESITDIGSALNELGASGAATAPFISDYALRVGAIAKASELGLDKVLGMGAALEELGFTAEVAGTATNKLLGALAGDASSFFTIAKLADANLTLKEFKSLVNNDINSALNLFLKGLNKGGAATTDFATLVQKLGIKGSGTTAVLTTLAKNTELVTEKQAIANTALREGTSLAKEAEEKNNNLAGSWDKLGNAIKNLTTGSGGPVTKFFQGILDYTTEIIKGNIDWAESLKSLIPGYAILTGKGIGPAFVVGTKNAAKAFDDFGAASLLAAKGNLEVVESSERLVAEFNYLNGIENRSTEQTKKLRAAVFQLKKDLGDNTVVLNTQTKQYELVSGAVEKAIAAKRKEGIGEEAALAKRLVSVTRERENQMALTSAIREEAANRLAILQQYGISQEKLAEQSKIRTKQESGNATFSVNEYRDVKGVPDAVLDQYEQISKLNEQSALSAKKAGDADKIRTAILQNFALAGRSRLYIEGLLVEATRESTEATLKDKNEMKDAAKAAKELAKALAELAQSEYELARFRAEQREKKFDRQSKNEANPEEFRMEAARKAAEEEKTIALLEQKEKLRLAKEAAKDLVNGDAVLAIKRQLISEQYAARIGEIERDLTKEQLEIHNDALSVLADIDAFRLETENNNLQKLIDNETAGFAVRTEAQKRFAANVILLASLAYDEEIRNAKGNVDKIKLALDKLNEAVAKAKAPTQKFDSDIANDEVDVAEKNALIELEINRKLTGDKSANDKAYLDARKEIEDFAAGERLANLLRDKDATKESLDAELEYLRQHNEDELALEKEKQERKMAIIEEAAELLMNIGAGVNEVYSAQLDEQLAALSRQKENDLAIAGDNAAAKQRIEADYDRQQAKIKRKQAVAAKAAALFEIALQTGIAVAKAVAASPLTFGLPFSAFALANGLIQAAIVIAKPIPAFAEGTNHAPFGRALVGEAGAELIEYNGKTQLITEPTIMELKGGTKVYNAKETVKYYEERSISRQLANGYVESEKAITQAQRGGATEMDVAKVISREIGTKFESLENAVKNQPTNVMSMDKNGVHGYVVQAGQSNELFNKRYHPGKWKV